MDMLSIHLDRLKGVPLYEQLYQYMKKEIVEGRIGYGVKLPSKRKLAEHLQISQNTVETAYNQLLAEGYIESVPRKGFFVSAREDLEYIQGGRFLPSGKHDQKERFRYDFHPNQIDSKHFPMDKWRKYAKEILVKNNHSLLLLGEGQGEYELRREIASYLYQARGVHCAPEEIIIGAGMEILLQQLLHLFDAETVFGVEDPGYQMITRLLAYYPNTIYPLNVDGEGVRVEQIEASPVRAVYVTPSHHFPYGVALSVNRRIKLLKWATKEKNRYIIEDDYNSEFRYCGTPIPSLKSMDQRDKVIYLGSFSKSLIPSLRISYMVLPKPLLETYKRELSFYHCSVSRIDQHILTLFMKNGDFERHLNRMRKIYRKKREKMLEALKPYGRKVDVFDTNSGFHVVVAVKNGMDERELMARALNAGLNVYSLSSYSVEGKTDNQPKMLLGFAGIPTEEIKNAVEALASCWRLGD